MQEETYGIYDGNGNLLRIATEDEQTGQETSGEYKAPLRVSAGASLSKTTFNSFKLTHYPSLNHVSKHSSSTTIGAFVVNVPGVVSSSDQSQVNYQILVDSRSFADTPYVYVLSPECENILHENIFTKGRFSFLPQKEICPLCLGIGFPEAFINCQSEKEKLGFLLHHIADVLNNPNLRDSAR